MDQWRYVIVQSNGQHVNTNSGSLNIAQVLNSAGASGGDLVAVVPAGANLFEWVIKFPAHAPKQTFE